MKKKSAIICVTFWIKEAFDKAGLIYGMGHAVYSLSDPRAVTFHSFVERLSEEKGYEKEFALYSLVERLAPEIIAEKRKIYKGVSPNVDFLQWFCISDAWSSTGTLYTNLRHRAYRRMERTPYGRSMSQGQDHASCLHDRMSTQRSNSYGRKRIDK